MKTIVSLFIAFVFQYSYAQTELQVLKDRSNALCTSTNNTPLFCKALHYYLNAQYDSCYILSAKALLTYKDDEKSELLHYFQGISAINKNLISKAVINFNKLSDKGAYSNLKKINLGYINVKKESFKTAIATYLSVIDLNTTLESYQIADLYHNLGISYLHLKEFSKAERYLDLSFNYLDKSDTASIVNSKINIANLYYEKYMDNKAIPLFYEAYDLAKASTTLSLKQTTAYNLAIVERNRKQYEKSFKFFDEFMALKDSITNRDRIWELTELDKKNALKGKEQELQIEKQKLKQQELISLFLLVVIGLILVIGYLIYRYRKKRLIFISEIQKLSLIEIERKRISEELHDGVLSKLFGIRLNLGFLNVKPNDKIKYDDLLKELQYVEKEVREVSHTLGTDIPERATFSLALKKMLETKSKQGDFSYDITIDDEVDWTVFNVDVIINVYRVLQEVFQNIIKHAKASHVSLVIRAKHKELSVSVEDNGIGFSVEENIDNGIGLLNIKSRAKKINASLDITSQLQSGSKLTLTIPY